MHGPMNHTALGSHLPPGPAIDPAALAKLHDLDPDGRAGIVQRVLETYQHSLAKLLLQLERALVSRAPLDLRHITHTLKSSSASVGAIGLSQLCAQIEQLAVSGWDDSLPERVATLQAEALRVQAALVALLKDRERR